MEDESSTVFGDHQNVDPPLTVDEFCPPDVVYVLTAVGAVVHPFVVKPDR
jgi:hypothetical protein